MNWALSQGGKIENIGISGTDGTQCTDTDNSTTKGSWAEISSATTFDYNAFLLQVHNDDVAGQCHLLDIGVGAASSEQVICSDLVVCKGRNSAAYAFGLRMMLPIQIPEGTRVAARIGKPTAVSGADTLRVSLLGINYGFAGPLGFSGAESLGTEADTAALITVAGNTGGKGSYVEVVSSTSKDYKAFMIQSDNNFLGGGASAVRAAYDISIGAASSEQVIVPDAQAAVNFSDDVVFPDAAGPFYTFIPEGSRIAVRHETSFAATNMSYGVVGLY